VRRGVDLEHRTVARQGSGRLSRLPDLEQPQANLTEPAGGFDRDLLRLSRPVVASAMARSRHRESGVRGVGNGSVLSLRRRSFMTASTFRASRKPVGRRSGLAYEDGGLPAASADECPGG
jgi:hypothetical protein